MDCSEKSSNALVSAKHSPCPVDDVVGSLVNEAARSLFCHPRIVIDSQHYFIVEMVKMQRDPSKPMCGGCVLDQAVLYNSHYHPLPRYR